MQNASMQNPLRAIVVDDEPLARDELKFLLLEAGDVEVIGEAADAKGALSLCDDETPDVAFVDLRMPGPDGISLAEALRQRCPQISVVVVSAHDEGALRAFEAQVLDYLLKPVRLERLKQTLERAQEINAQKPASTDQVLTRLAVKRRGGFVVLDIADVVYFEVRDELVWAVTASDRFALDLTMANLEQRLPTDAFFRSHRGALVRLDLIRAIEPTGAGTFELIMEHPEEARVPLARERARSLRTLIPVGG